MALSDLEKLFVVSTASQMWQQDLLTNAYFQGSAVGANLREMVLGRELSDLLGDVSTIEDIYAERASGLEYQAAALKSQATCWTRPWRPVGRPRPCLWRKFSCAC